MISTCLKTQEQAGRSQPTHAGAPLDVLVIGAGQAGLAAGYYLRASGLSFALLDAHTRVGGSWRERYDSLVLFTTRRYSALPGLAIPGDPDGYPTRDEIADYLESYAAAFRLPVQHGQVVRLEAVGDGFVATTAEGARMAARAVIIATGAFQVPVVPAFADRLAPEVQQFTLSTYRNPKQVPSGRVLVVGDGASGRQIALDLASTHEVLLAGGKRRNLVPQRVFGRDLFFWLDRLGLTRADRDSAIGRLLRARDPIPGRAALEDAVMHRAGIGLHSRLTGTAGRTVTFADGRTAEVDTVVWALGYRDDTSWLAVPGAADSGGFVQDRGRTPVPGLYHVGRSWQTSRGSALLLGVERDAQAIVTEAVQYLGAQGVREEGFSRTTEHSTGQSVFANIGVEATRPSSRRWML